jgi:hypothetical protein
MNNKYGRDGRYPEPRSPDEEFETSGPYRQPREPVAYGPAQRERFRFDDLYAPAFVPERVAERYGSEARGGHSGRGPKDYTRSDQRIREDVCDRLSWNDEVDATEISVLVADGEVTLEGTVETRHMKRLSEDLAESVPGVIDVHNRIRVTKPMLTELKEKLSGESGEHHFAHTGTKKAG